MSPKPQYCTQLSFSFETSLQQRQAFCNFIHIINLICKRRRLIQAAILVQAHARGWLARKHVKAAAKEATKGPCVQHSPHLQITVKPRSLLVRSHDFFSPITPVLIASNNHLGVDQVEAAKTRLEAARGVQENGSSPYEVRLHTTDFLSA